METLVQLVALVVYLLASLSALATALAALLWSARQQQQLERDRAALVEIGARETLCLARLAALELRLKVIDDAEAAARAGGQRQPTPLS